jgi:hypothetical protein
VDVNEQGYENVDWIKVALGRVKCIAIVYLIKILGFYKKTENFLHRRVHWWASVIMGITL